MKFDLQLVCQQMVKMEAVHVHLLLLLIALVQGIQGQAISPLSVGAAVGDTVSLECTTTAPDGFTFTWIEVSTGTAIYGGGIKNPEGYVNFDLDENTTERRSTLIINGILLENAGQYRCTIFGQVDEDPATVHVEAGSQQEDITLVSPDNTNYKATCEAIGSSVEETITWILDGVIQTAPPADIVETDPGTPNDSVFDKISVFTFPATLENYNAQLECNISGHQVTKLNRHESRLVNIHKIPQPADIVIEFDSDGTSLNVLCNTDAAAAEPPMNEFYIYANGTLIADKPLSDNTVTVPEPEQDTNYTCVGGNYLGNTTTSATYKPGRTTTPPPTTGPTTGNVGAIVGGVVGGIVLIIIIVLVIKFVVKPECMGGSGFSFQALFACCKCSLPSNSGGSRKKPASSAVGSSNGSEKDKIKPSAAPRTQSSIQHTTDNPEQAEYAMVDRKPGGGGKGGGDMPDKGYGAGQNEPAGMVYADLDLSAKAGHTEKQIPQNKDDVVVYSSILV